MRFQTTSFAVLALVLFAQSSCQDLKDSRESTGIEAGIQNAKTEGTSGPVPTFVGPIERLVMLLMKPLEITDDALDRIGKGLGWGIKGITKWFPVPKTAGSVGDTVKSIGDVLNPFKEKIRAIYPGTRWCGDGDIARNEDDLGFFKTTDACCRAHDTCLGGIPAQEVRHGLLNNGLFTRSPCHCDEAFYECLKNAANLVATKIGTTYFNFLRPQCFKQDYPITGCKTHSGRRLIHDKCLEYKFDKNGTEVYQWMDSPDFLNFIEI